jgi:hypothetical protein
MRLDKAAYKRGTECTKADVGYPASARTRGRRWTGPRDRGIWKRSLSRPWYWGGAPLRIDAIAAAVTLGLTELPAIVDALAADRPRI